MSAASSRRSLPGLLIVALVAALVAVAPLGSSSPAAAQTSGLGVGVFDRADLGPDGLLVSGWVIDPDATTPSEVHVYVDGVLVATTTADLPRPDVAAFFGIGPEHGFRVLATDLPASVTPGRSEVCAWVIDQGEGFNRPFTCGLVRGADGAVTGGDQTPIGRIDRVVAAGDTLTVAGWALDPDTDDAIAVHVYVDGVIAGAGLAAIPRPDVDAVHGRGPLHGFRLDLPLPDGAGRVCVFGIDADGPPNAAIGCAPVVPDLGTLDGDGLGVIVTPRGIVTPLLAAVPGGWRVQTPCGNPAVVTDGTYLPRAHVVIDPGHGGSESGAVGSNGIYEKTLNLEIALMVEAQLEAAGYQVQLTRTSDYRVPIRSRGDIANALEPLLFLSIHHNGGAIARRATPGTEVFYQHDSAEARRAGGILYEEIFAAMRRFSAQWVGTSNAGVTARLRDPSSDLYGIHRYTPDVVSVITEALYLSNPSEAALMATQAAKDAEAAAITAGVIRYLTTDDAGSGFRPQFIDPGSTGTGGFEGCTDPLL